MVSRTNLGNAKIAELARVELEQLGRHRTFAAAQASVEQLPVFVLLRANAVFAY